MKPFLLLLLTFVTTCDAALAQTAAKPRLREESFLSSALGRTMKYRVLVPQGYEGSERRYPVLYLLHGLTGDYKDWTTRTNLAEYTRALALIIVMPDGENQWYTNAADGTAKFEDYINADLPADVVSKYRTVNSRFGRAIAGLSMGGYGALKLGLKRPGQFAVVGAFSGAFGATRPSDGYDRMIASVKAPPLTSIFGPAESDTRKQNDVLALAAGMKPAAAPYIYIDCGTSDQLIAENRDVVAALHKAGVAYEYHEIAGAHSWDYWDRRIREFLPILMKRLAN